MSPDRLTGGPGLAAASVVLEDETDAELETARLIPYITAGRLAGRTGA
ncbi:hypothetical protein ABIC21_000768 [Pseudarthrobacter sp. PvP090]